MRVAGLAFAARVHRGATRPGRKGGARGARQLFENHTPRRSIIARPAMDPRKRPIAAAIVSALLAAGGAVTLLHIVRTAEYRSATRSALTFLVAATAASHALDFLQAL